LGGLFVVALPVNKIKGNGFSVLVWDTDNVSFVTDQPLELEPVLKLLRANRLRSVKVTEDFIVRVNENLKKGDPRHFIFIQSSPKEGFVEYLSRQGKMRVYKNEIMVQVELSPNAEYEKVLAFLKEKNITNGIDEALIKDKLEQNDYEWFVVASGTGPSDFVARDYTYEYEVERNIPLDILQNEKAFFLDVSLPNRVFKDEVIVSYTKEKVGINGLTVSNVEIPAIIKPKKEVSLGMNVYRKGTNIYSKMEGIVFFSDQLISVIPMVVYRRNNIPDEIDFNGTVIIEGKVENLKIKAKNDVIIHGTANECQIEAGGFVYLLSGVVGEKSSVEAVYDVFSSYISHANVVSKHGNVIIGRETYFAKIKASRAVIIAKKAIAGRIESNQLIQVGSAGSDKTNSPTEFALSIGKNGEDLISDTIAKLDDLQEKIAKIKLLKEKMEQVSTEEALSSDSNYQNILNVEQVFERDILHNKSCLICADTFPELEEKKIIIEGDIWDGVKIEINGKELEIKVKIEKKIYELGDYGITKMNYVPKKKPEQ
jgi:uncharacterized protein